MNEAKAAVQGFISKHGHHETDVTEHHRPAVVHEHVTPTRHEEATTVIDREVHQDHHHTSVQPIHHREVLPEQHKQNVVPVEHKEHRHGDHEGIKERLAAEAAQFKDVREKGKTEHTHEINPVIAGEHRHHHVHETIQPIIQKETIQPSVVHTTVPIHEVHHNAPQHHAATALPAISMAEFKKQGGSLKGMADRTDHFEGEPQSETSTQHAKHGGLHHHGIGGTGGTAATGGLASSGVGSNTNDSIGSTGGVGRRDDALDRDRNVLDRDSNGAGVGAAGTEGLSRRDNGVDPRIDANSRRNEPLGSTTTGTTRNEALDNSTGTSGLVDSTRTNNLQNGSSQQYADTHAGSRMDTEGDRGIASTTGNGVNTTRVDADATNPKKRASLLDRLNPLKDSDGDGKKGVNN